LVAGKSHALRELGRKKGSFGVFDFGFQLQHRGIGSRAEPASSRWTGCHAPAAKTAGTTELAGEPEDDYKWVCLVGPKSFDWRPISTKNRLFGIFHFGLIATMCEGALPFRI
jgi:hypothetical protein